MTKKYKMYGETAQKNERITAYKLSRINARKNGEKITQEQAAENLNVSREWLSKYETGDAPVPDDMVVAMAEYYEMPILLWWHLQHHTVFGKYLPDVPDLKNLKDIIFENVMLLDRHEKMFKKLKEIAEDLSVAPEKADDWKKCIHDMKVMSASFFAMSMCAEQAKTEAG